MKFENLLPLLAIGALAIYVVNKAKDKISDELADIYLWLLLPANVNITSKLVLPDHTLLSFAGIKTYWISDKLYADVKGRRYQLHPRDARGNYPATLA